MIGWQPIATAPKDGTAIILYSPDGPKKGRWIGFYRQPTEATWRIVGEGEKRGPLEGEAGHKSVGTPTHWMPLPDPPVIK